MVDLELEDGHGPLAVQRRADMHVRAKEIRDADARIKRCVFRAQLLGTQLIAPPSRHAEANVNAHVFTLLSGGSVLTPGNFSRSRYVNGIGASQGPCPAVRTEFCNSFPQTHQLMYLEKSPCIEHGEHPGASHRSGARGPVNEIGDELMSTLVENETTAPGLDQLAVEINQAHEAAERSVRDSLLRAREAGQKLIAVKRQLEHGAFMPWVAQHCECSHASANLYMKIARNWDAVLGKSDNIQNISLHQANMLLRSRDETEVGWETGLVTTEADRAANRLLTAAYGLARSLQGGALHTDMQLVSASRATLLRWKEKGLLEKEMPDEFQKDELWKIACAFAECRRHVDRCLEVLHRRMNDLPVIWDTDAPGLLWKLDNID